MDRDNRRNVCGDCELFLEGRGNGVEIHIPGEKPVVLRRLCGVNVETLSSTPCKVPEKFTPRMHTFPSNNGLREGEHNPFAFLFSDDEDKK